MVATRGSYVGAEAPAAKVSASDRGDEIGTKIAYAGIGIIFLGMGVYALNARQLAKMPL